MRRPSTRIFKLGGRLYYDGYGRRVKELTELRRFWGERITNVSARPIRMGKDTTDYLCLSLDGRMYVFGPEN